MLEDYTVETGLRKPVPRNPIAYYFARAKDLELGEEYLHFLTEGAKELHITMLQEAYDVLYDRVMTTRLSPYLKQELEQWYGFNRDFLGFCDTTNMNRELEDMFRRFELL